MPKLVKGTDLRSVGASLAGSSPALPTKTHEHSGIDLPIRQIRTGEECSAVLVRLEKMMRLALALLLVCSTANAEYYSGNELLMKMESDSVVDRSIALGYVMGVSDMGQGIVHCSPMAVTAGQTRDVVKAHLSHNPADRHHSADVIVNKVLKSVWPCKATGRGI